MTIILATGIGLAILLLALLVLFRFSRHNKLSAHQARKIKRLWCKIEENPNQTVQILEADMLLNEALKLLGFQGTLGEKLKAAGPRFSCKDDVWSAHKLRNRLAHELHSKPSQEEVRRALRSFERGLKDLGMR